MKKISVAVIDQSPIKFTTQFKQLQKQSGLAICPFSNIFELVQQGLDLQDAIFAHVGNAQQGFVILDELSGKLQSKPVIIIADEASVDDAVTALRKGAADFFTMPCSKERLLEAMNTAGIDTTQHADEKSSKTSQRGGLGNIIGKSKKMKAVFSLIRKICDTDTTVLIQGESGTGKELIAQALHFEGNRCSGPFIPVNCGAIPGELLESELFGHEKGAFTHALNTRIGRFELADGGTVFLDEISEMSPMLQVKILRVLQERQFERIGGTRTIKSDFRIIAATNRDLDEEVKAGRFREDLFYRLNVIPIKAPPLRERPTDIIELAEHFVEKFDRKKNKKVAGITSDAQKILLQYGWPGNVRELENVIERMVILAAAETLAVGDLPEKMQAAQPHARGNDIDEIPDANFCLSDEVAAFEKKLIIQALNQTNWVKNRAAKLLNVNRTTLLEKMKRYKLEKPKVKLEN